MVIDVKELREALGWTQQQMSAYCGVDRSTVSKWESEPPTKGPALILLQQLASGIPQDADRVSPAGAAADLRSCAGSFGGAP